MSDEEQKEVFARNLNYYIEANGKSQREIADAIEVSPQTFNTWCQGIAYPRAGKLQRLADYFRINKSDLIEDHPFHKYYFDDEVARIADQIFHNEDLRVLFDTAQGSTPEGVQAAISVLSTLKKREEGNDE